MTAIAHRPDPALARRLKQLDRANALRRAGRDAKVRASVEGVPAVIEMLSTGHAGAVRIHELLEAVPKIGEVKAERILKQLHIWPLRRVRSLTERQQGLLVAELERQSASKHWLTGGEL